MEYSNHSGKKKPDLRAKVKALGGTQITTETMVPMESQLLKRLKPDELGKKTEALGGVPITEKTVEKIETPAMSDTQKRAEIARIVKRLNEELAPSNKDEKLIKGLKEEDHWSEKEAANEDGGNDYGDLKKFLESKKLPVEETSKDVVEKPEKEQEQKDKFTTLNKKPLAVG